jgi:glutamate-1-semialdehyde 2,1-aminomutase/spore coat polysaccharide biosynthesis protein SpsF
MKTEEIRRTIAIVQARLGSTRLPGKVLRDVGGQPMLAWLLERLLEAWSLDGIVVATSGSPADDPIEEFCDAEGFDVFRGSESDVLDRYYRCAVAFGATTIVRLTSDCPMLDPMVVDEVVETFHHSDLDFAANTAPPPGRFPDGMDVEVFSFETLETIWREAREPAEREHVTFAIWQHPERFRLGSIEPPEEWGDLSGVRLTIDTPDDLDAFAQIVEHFDAEKSGLPGVMELVTFARERWSDPARGHMFGEGWQKAVEPAGAPLELARGNALFARAKELIPGGAQTFSKCPSQYVEGTAPKVLVRGAGSRVWDADGNEYLDYVLGLGPAVLGHARAEVNAAAARAAALFNTPSLPHPLELELAEKLVEWIPCAEMVRFGKNGSDVTAGAMRIARAVTGRDMLLCAGYHGWQDWYIGTTTRDLGVPRATADLTTSFAWGDLADLEAKLKEHAVAGVILEPVTLEEPPAGYLAGVRALCDRYGALLIFDEIITGFRLDMGGAQTVFGVTPDLTTLGKAIAGGYPLSALVGRRDLMQVLDEAFFSFTFGGELPPIAAALETIRILEDEAGIETLAARGAELRAGIDAAAAAAGLPCLTSMGLDFFPGYHLEAVGETTALELQTLLQQELVRRGILTRSCFFLSTAHGPADIAATGRAFEESAVVLARALESGSVRATIDGADIEPVFRARL